MKKSVQTTVLICAAAVWVISLLNIKQSGAWVFGLVGLVTLIATVALYKGGDKL